MALHSQWLAHTALRRLPSDAGSHSGRLPTLAQGCCPVSPSHDGCFTSFRSRLIFD